MTVYLLLGKLVDGLLSPRPYLLLGSFGLFPDLLFSFVSWPTLLATTTTESAITTQIARTSTE